MNVFFVSYASDDFTYNPRIQAEFEFKRLRLARKWDQTTPEYKRVHRKFLEALVEDPETTGPVHEFFITQYPDFDYDSRASPKLEFKRLRDFRKWKTTGRPYKRAKRLFKDAFDKEFDSDLDEYFKSFPEFDYNPRDEPKGEFERLTKLKNWKKRDYDDTEKDEVLRQIYKEAREEFFEAFVSVFSYFFGIDEDLRNWSFLCDILGVSPVPETAEECKTRLEPLHVNIYNLLDHMQEKVPIIFFPDLKGLISYSWGNNPKRDELIYPLELAQGNQLKFLLRRIGKRKKARIRAVQTLPH